jgi:hypothetical protein
MPTEPWLGELREAWLPHLTDTGLARIAELIEKESPLLVAGCFTKALPMGCLASHAAWHHPQTAHLNIDAGILWLTRIAGLNPATSHVIQEWDRRGGHDREFRAGLLAAFRQELSCRGPRRSPAAVG